MLIKVTDSRGRDQYINAVYVKAVHPKGFDQCMIEVSGRSTRIRVRQPVETIVEQINEAMPNSLEAILAAEDQQHIDQMAAASSAAV